MKKHKTAKEIFKKAYSLARTPDKFLADKTFLTDIPVDVFLAALHCAGFKYSTGYGFKTLIKET